MNAVAHRERLRSLSDAMDEHYYAVIESAAAAVAYHIGCGMRLYFGTGWQEIFADGRRTTAAWIARWVGRLIVAATFEARSLLLDGIPTMTDTVIRDLPRVAPDIEALRPNVHQDEERLYVALINPLAWAAIARVRFRGDKVSSERDIQQTLEHRMGAVADSLTSEIWRQLEALPQDIKGYGILT